MRHVRLYQISAKKADVNLTKNPEGEYIAPCIKIIAPCIKINPHPTVRLRATRNFYSNKILACGNTYIRFIIIIFFELNKCCVFTILQIIIFY